jgi:HAD superfamily hydrolase (TIGR01509 family)
MGVPNHMLQAIIFDMDGTIVDSTKYIWESFNALLKDQGVHFTDDDVKRFLGLSLRDQIEIWKKDYGVKDIVLEDFSRKATDLQLELLKNEFALRKGLQELLDDAKKHNIKLAVATNSRIWRTKKYLEALKIEDYFDATVTSEEVHNHKPNPDLFLEAARRLNVNPENCVVFEDAADGIEAAVRSGMKSVAVKTRFHTKEELHKADLIINDFSEINIDKLKKLF